MISEKISKLLDPVRQPYEEDEAVVRRLVNAYRANFKQPTPVPSGPADKGRSHLPQKALREPLLDALATLGPRVEVTEVRKWLAKRLQPKLTSADYEKVAGGSQERWWHFVHWNRMLLVQEGILRDNSPHGVWELTEEGKRLVSQRGAKAD